MCLFCFFFVFLLLLLLLLLFLGWLLWFGWRITIIIIITIIITNAIAQLRAATALPSSQYPSDHLPLLAVFELLVRLYPAPIPRPSLSCTHSLSVCARPRFRIHRALRLSAIHSFDGFRMYL